MKKIKYVAASFLSFGMVLTSSMTSYATELSRQPGLALYNIIADQAFPFSAYARITLDVKGNGVRLRGEVIDSSIGSCGWIADIYLKID